VLLLLLNKTSRFEKIWREDSFESMRMVSTSHKFLMVVDKAMCGRLPLIYIAMCAHMNQEISKQDKISFICSSNGKDSLLNPTRPVRRKCENC
jgi:hypothetical protein